MKTAFARLRQFALLTLAASALQAAPEVINFYAIGSKANFVLMDEVDGQATASSWLKLGDSFSGYKLDKYNAKSLKLTLTQGKVRTEIPLKPTRPTAYSAVMEGTITVPGKTLNNVQVLVYEGADLNLQLTKEVTLSLKNKLMKDGALLHTARFLTLQDDGTTDRTMAFTIEQKPGAKILLDVGDYVIDLSPAS